MTKPEKNPLRRFVQAPTSRSASLCPLLPSVTQCYSVLPTFAECYSGLSAVLQPGDVRATEAWKKVARKRIQRIFGGRHRLHCGREWKMENLVQVTKVECRIQLMKNERKVFLLRKDPHNWEKFKIKQFRVRRPAPNITGKTPEVIFCLLNFYCGVSEKVSTGEMGLLVKQWKYVNLLKTLWRNFQY